MSKYLVYQDILKFNNNYEYQYTCDIEDINVKIFDNLEDAKNYAYQKGVTVEPTNKRVIRYTVNDISNVKDDDIYNSDYEIYSSDYNSKYSLEEILKKADHDVFLLADEVKDYMEGDG